MLAQEHWNMIVAKECEESFFLDKLHPFLTLQSQIVDYGCNQGHLLYEFKANGYRNLIGFDSSSIAIERGKLIYPELDLRVLEKGMHIPCLDASLDAVVLSSALHHISNALERELLMADIWRVLKNKGILYVSDFLICEHSFSQGNYVNGFKEFNDWGLHVAENQFVVRHYSVQAIMDLLKNFEIQWFEQFDFRELPTRRFHCIARKRFH
ncbi:tRNA (cmo5U34)-methyltransferase [Parachlamydia acanthamoebae UV-7]|jgi:SAM-dependent methyltransferase|uniref:tRNA (Cmo5U34)-methyltransferase n=3 Tax=Parachlamydia acanthamoebae TaxID=83552 RepID=F8L1B0_PARAV|nr:class I SAM-dependent methyltransferase [Parachlamydia acanthamoebae]EFB40659.1 hypothetical protein pah_c197o042 [Parachlamydia acanthamoebae str. Hall's coccus]CCB87040.1 tRNA (cmo5U34)-methyltransferase [Parachlamydia acanthamoebae UV-7]